MSRQLAELCDHGRYVGCRVIIDMDKGPVRGALSRRCPGGRLVEVNLQPLMVMFDQLFLSLGRAPSDLEQLRRNAQKAVDAALGVEQ